MPGASVDEDGARVIRSESRKPAGEGSLDGQGSHARFIQALSAVGAMNAKEGLNIWGNTITLGPLNDDDRRKIVSDFRAHSL